jgi:hypothetical protein
MSLIHQLHSRLISRLIANASSRKSGFDIFSQFISDVG